MAEKICGSLCEKIKKDFNNIDIILTPAIGGIVVGYEIGRQLGIETIFSERYEGTMVLRRGFNIPKKSNVLIVEDVITTGKSALECHDLLKSFDANHVGYACIIDRSSENLLIKNKIVSQIALSIETYKPNSLPDNLKKIDAVKPGSRISNK